MCCRGLRQRRSRRTRSSIRSHLPTLVGDPELGFNTSEKVADGVPVPHPEPTAGAPDQTKSTTENELLGRAIGMIRSAVAARRFIVGKLFAFTCADGSRGAARVYDDGSVIGTIQFHGSEQPRPVWLPAETLKLTGDTVCASLNRTELCFALSKTNDQSFRVSVTGLDFAYCDFTERVAPPILYRDRSLQSRCHLTRRVMGRSKRAASYTAT
jgi:hypothetical protein